MLTMTDLDPLLRRHSTLVTDQGDRVGSMGVVYLDDADDEPTWVTVHTGLFGTRESFVPLKGASVRGHDLVVAYPRDLIRNAPSVERDGHLSPEEETALYRHYGLRGSVPTTAPDVPTAASSASPAASTASSPAASPMSTHSTAASPAPTFAGTDGRDDGGTPWMIRSEERLRVGTEEYQAARVRLRKYVVTEQATMTVPLKREELLVEVEPITSAALEGSDDVPFQEQSVELVAREEWAIVSKETVPVERVQMNTVTVKGRTTVREEMRKERIASSVEGDVADPEERSGRSAAGPAVADSSSRIATNSTNALLKGKKRC